ncbi:MAG: hypothetical protein ACIARR_12785 [Phycisphaerales bacterium JB059]
MLRVVLGPTFDIPLPRPRAEVTAQLTDWLANARCPFEGRVVGDHRTLTVCDRDRHFWSPWLTLSVHDTPADDGAPACLVHARFNPHPSIWSAVIFSGLALLTISAIAAMWGVAQLIMGHTPLAWIVIPACFILAGALYWTSHIGQAIADEQMNTIQQGVRDALTPPT